MRGVKNKKPKGTSPKKNLEELWMDGFFVNPKQVKETLEYLEEKGINFLMDSIRKAHIGAQYLTSKKKGKGLVYVQKYPPSKNGDIELEKVELFDNKIVSALGKDFETEIEDLRLNFGRSGNCTAFLLRKILEKLLFFVFAKNSLKNLIEDKNKPGGLVGLAKMIKIAPNNQINNTDLMTKKTAEKLDGIKFLGDTAAHNPLVNVDPETIDTQWPFVITAIKELLRHLK